MDTTPFDSSGALKMRSPITGSIPNVPANSVAAQTVDINFPLDWAKDEHGRVLRNDGLFDSFTWYVQEDFYVGENDMLRKQCVVVPQEFLIRGWQLEDAKFYNPTAAGLVLLGTYSKKTGLMQDIAGNLVPERAMENSVARLIGARDTPLPFEAGSDGAKVPVSTPVRRTLGVKREANPNWLSENNGAGPRHIHVPMNNPTHVSGALPGATTQQSGQHDSETVNVANQPHSDESGASAASPTPAQAPARDGINVRINDTPDSPRETGLNISMASPEAPRQTNQAQSSGPQFFDMATPNQESTSNTNFSDRRETTSTSIAGALPPPATLFRPPTSSSSMTQQHSTSASASASISAANSAPANNSAFKSSPVKITHTHVPAVQTSHRQGNMSTIVEEPSMMFVETNEESALPSMEEIVRQHRELDETLDDLQLRDRDAYDARREAMERLQRRRNEVAAQQRRTEEYEHEVAAQQRRIEEYERGTQEHQSNQNLSSQLVADKSPRAPYHHGDAEVPPTRRGSGINSDRPYPSPRLHTNRGVEEMPAQTRRLGFYERDLDHPLHPRQRAIDHLQHVQNDQDRNDDPSGQSNDPYGDGQHTSKREKETLRELGNALERLALLESRMHEDKTNARDQSSWSYADQRKLHRENYGAGQVGPREQRVSGAPMAPLLRSNKTPTVAGFAVHEDAFRQNNARIELLQIEDAHRAKPAAASFADDPGNVNHKFPELQPTTARGAVNANGNAVDHELITRQMASALIKLASQQSQQSNKVTAPKCELHNYRSKTVQLPSMLQAYLTALWKYVGLSTGQMELAVHLMSHTQTEFLRLVYMSVVDWSAESPTPKIPDALNRTSHQGAEVIVQNIVKSGSGDSESHAGAIEWISLFSTDNFSMEEAMSQSPWTELVAYVIKLKLKYDNIVLRQDELQKVILKPPLAHRTIVEDLNNWNQNLVMLSKHDPNAARFCTKTGVPYIHQRLLELFRSDKHREIQLVQAADDYGIKLLNCDHASFVKYILDVRAKMAPTLLEQRDAASRSNFNGASAGASSGNENRFASRCVKNIFGLCSDRTCKFSHGRDAPFPPRFMDMAKGIVSSNSGLEIKPWMLKKNAESKGKRVNMAQLCDLPESSDVSVPANFQVFKGDFDQNAWDSESEHEFDDACSHDAYGDDNCDEPQFDVAICNPASTDVQVEGIPFACIDDGTDLGDVCINTDIVLNNGVFVSCKALTPSPEQKEKECAAFHGMGFCPYEMMYGKCDFVHHPDKRKHYLNVYCDPKKCRFRAACPKNHSKEQRRDIDVTFTAKQANFNFQLQSDIAAGWDMTAMIAAMKNKDGPTSGLIHVKAMFAVAQLDGSSLVDTGANGNVLDARDPRVLRISDDTVPLHTSDGSAGFQRVGTVLVPFHDRGARTTHSRDAPPPRQQWVRACAILVNVDKPAAEFSVAILPATWIAHFAEPGPSNFEFLRKEGDKLQPDVSKSRVFADLGPADIAMFWHNRLPYLAAAEVVSFCGSDRSLHPLPWTPQWKPPEFTKEVNRDEHDRLFDDLFRSGLEVPISSSAPGRV